jgi:hypothetical protein
MTAGTPLVMRDAFVLANFTLCDTLLRSAEPPRLFEPKWPDEINRETTRTLESKLGWPDSLTAYLEAELQAHFGEAWIRDYEHPDASDDERREGSTCARGRGPLRRPVDSYVQPTFEQTMENRDHFLLWQSYICAKWLLLRSANRFAHCWHFQR